MRFDIIVFSQRELENAIDAGYRFIALCDGSFVLPDTEGISYVHIGQVHIGQARTAVGEAAISDGGDTCAACALPPLPCSLPRYPSSHSFGGSMSGSYAYAYVYAYSLGSSFGSSYSSLYWSLYSSFSGFGSFGLGSFGFGSYRYGSFGFGSFTYGSFGSFCGASLYPFEEFEECCPFVYVNGYGINLI